MTRAVTLSRKAIRRAQQLSHALFECGDDIQYWCERIGYSVVEKELPDGFDAVLYDGIVVLRPQLSPAEKIVTIAHEIFHHEFHGASVAFREVADDTITRDECQADSFGVLTQEFSLLRYDSIDEFMVRSPLPQHLKELRRDLFYLIWQ